MTYVGLYSTVPISGAKSTGSSEYVSVSCPMISSKNRVFSSAEVKRKRSEVADSVRLFAYMKIFLPYLALFDWEVPSQRSEWNTKESVNECVSK